MVFAVAPDRGITCFLVDRDMGWKSEPIPTMGEWWPAALIFEDVRVPASGTLGEVEGTDEIQRLTIARNLLKGHVKLGGIGE